MRRILNLGDTRLAVDDIWILRINLDAGNSRGRLLRNVPPNKTSEISDIQMRPISAMVLKGIYTFIDDQIKEDVPIEYNELMPQNKKMKRGFTPGVLLDMSSKLTNSFFMI